MPGSSYNPQPQSLLQKLMTVVSLHGVSLQNKQENNPLIYIKGRRDLHTGSISLQIDILLG